jgi:homoserine O-acetyltransferase/O-succinyltransferase
MDGPTGTGPRGVDRLPVTGAWRPGDPTGRRRFLTIAQDRPLALEGGGALREVTVAYETWGQLADDAGNAVLVCHALTGDSHVAGRIGPGHPTPGWWDPLVGPGRVLDTNRHFIVCANVLGGCQGSTGPASLDPATGRPHASGFPMVTIRDMVRTQAALADHLRVDRWLAVVGGSMGGMQVLEWAVMFPDRVKAIAALATTSAATAQQIAWSSIQRHAIATDPGWRGGEFYDATDGEGPQHGLSLARQLAQVTYRSERVFAERFGRGALDELDFTQWQRFDVEGYLHYHGQKLVRRFDANTYLVLSKAMDLHDLGRGRGGVHRALGRVRAQVLAMGIDSDGLFPPYLQRDIVEGIRSHGRQARYVEINSPDGHDGFLLATDQVAAALGPFLEEVEKSDA